MSGISLNYIRGVVSVRQDFLPDYKSMLSLKLKMHQNPFGGRAPRGPTGELTALSLDPLIGLSGGPEAPGEEEGMGWKEGW